MPLVGDITDPARLQQELEFERERLRLSLDVHKALVADLDLRNLFKALPARLRRVTEPEKDERTGQPFSSRSTRERYRIGAERFGWAARNPESRSVSDGRRLIGFGMATTVYHAILGAAGALARLLANGRAEVESAASDIGPGTYTSMTQFASDALGMPSGRVRFALGDSNFPSTAPHLGSQTMASVGSAVHVACLAVCGRALATTDGRSPLHGARADAVDAADGRLFLRADPSRGDGYKEILARNGLEVLEAAETVSRRRASSVFHECLWRCVRGGDCGF